MVVFEKYLTPGMWWGIALAMVMIGFEILSSVTTPTEKKIVMKTKLKKADDSNDMKGFFKGLLFVLIGVGIGLYAYYAGEKIA